MSYNMKKQQVVSWDDRICRKYEVYKPTPDWWSGNYMKTDLSATYYTGAKPENNTVRVCLDIQPVYPTVLSKRTKRPRTDPYGEPTEWLLYITVWGTDDTYMSMRKYYKQYSGVHDAFLIWFRKITNLAFVSIQMLEEMGFRYCD